MGWFDRLRSVFEGGDRSPNHPQGGGSSPDPGETIDRRETAGAGRKEPPAPERGGDSPRPTVGELVAELRDPSGDRVALAELLELASADPGSFEGELEGLVATVDHGEEYASAAGAMVLHALVEESPDRVAPHADDLLAGLLREDAATRESVRDVLDVLARRGKAPTDALVDVLTDDTPEGRWAAASVLASVGATRPEELPVQRLAERYRNGDPTTRGCVGYVLAVVQARRPDAVDIPAVTREGVVELAREVGAADTGGWAGDQLIREAIPLVVEASAPDVALEGVDVARTPAGVAIVLEVGSTEALDGEFYRAIESRLEERLDLEDPQVDVREIGE